jgi:Tol biopolymer transport system component
VHTATVLVAVLLAAAGCQIRRQPAPVGVGLLEVADVARATDRAALSPVAWSPDAHRFVYGARDGVWMHRLGDGRGSRIAPGEAVTAVAWSNTAGSIAYVDRGVLFTMQPDGARRRRVPLRGVASLPAWAPGGDRLVVAVHQPGAGAVGGDASGPRLWVTSPDGAMLRQIMWQPRGRSIAALGWYPDALHLFVGLAPGDGETIAEWWRIRIAYPDFRRLPAVPSHVLESLLSPTGEWVAYIAAEAGGERVYLVRTDGSGRRAASAVARRASGLAWAPHGDKMAYGVLISEAQAEVHVAAAMGGMQKLVAGYRLEFPDPAAGMSLTWSPDEARLAYGTNTGSMAGPVWIAHFAPR